eukprot:scaffold16541_cov70-Skeletonema_marinoi.AAC.1
MRTQNLAAPHGPKSVAFREFIAAAPYLNPSSQQLPTLISAKDSLQFAVTPTYWDSSSDELIAEEGKGTGDPGPRQIPV